MKSEYKIYQFKCPYKVRNNGTFVFMKIYINNKSVQKERKR